MLIQNWCCFCTRNINQGQPMVYDPNVGIPIHSECARRAARAADKGDAQRKEKANGKAGR